MFRVTIPFLGVQGCIAPTLPSACPGDTNHGERLAAEDGDTLSLANGTLNNPNFTGLAGFTSAGPRTGDGFLKPQITAPGVSIFSTLNASGNLPGGNSGTSMAAPHVAGVAALVKQAHPGWRAEDLMAAVANTGNPGGVGPSPGRPPTG